MNEHDTATSLLAHTDQLHAHTAGPLPRCSAILGGSFNRLGACQIANFAPRGFRNLLFGMLILLCMISLSTPTTLHAQLNSSGFMLEDGDRVVFLGDTFFEREGAYGHIESRLHFVFADRNIQFRNLSWAGDTPLGRARASFDWSKSPDQWLQRVKDQVALVKPTVAFLSYAMSASFNGPEGLEDYKRQLTQLMAAVNEAADQPVRFALFSPIGCEKTPELSQELVDSINANLKLYSDATRIVANQQKARFVDFMRMTTIRKSEDTPQWTDNGIHLNHQGYYMISYQVQFALGQNTIARYPTGPYETMRRAVVRKNELFFHRWRPANWTYLLGFRKHEQGQNAVELEQFEPIIKEWEERISKLRKVTEQDPETAAEVARLTSLPTPEEVGEAAPPLTPQPHPTFSVHEDFEVSLWAENPLLHKPIQINWDARGRLWVASSEVYPQVKPGQSAVDSVVILEDTNGDGVADKSTVFATGLLIPTGILPDNRGGCYVADSHQLIHLSDTNGDGRADARNIVLSSFGTEDTHHNLHTLRRGFDGHIYMNQSIYTHSHIETPFGVKRLNSGGIWRFDHRTWNMDVFTYGACNPWGHHWDPWGNQFFTDGAGFKGIYHATDGATYFTYADMRREAESITPGNWPKFCSLELVHSPSFPASWQGQAITCDFRAHRLVRFNLDRSGSTFAGKEQSDLLRSSDVTFRPIDIRFGPDGALYIADWSNPIIQHGEVDFRDPRRDKEHGRIWRVVAKPAARSGGPTLLPKIDLTKLDIPSLLDMTLHANGWHQEQARDVLSLRPREYVLPAALTWLEKANHPRAALEVAWLYEAFSTPAPNLSELLASDHPDVRAAAIHLLARRP